MFKVEDIKAPDIPVVEQETTITWMRDSDNVRLYTCDSLVLTKLKKHADEPEYILEKSSEYGSFFIIPKNLIRFGSKREMTDEQRAAIAERLAKARETNADASIEAV